MNNYKTLKLNDTGDDVKLLQQLLKILGLYPASITGSFDTTTENAVKDFQRENNLRVTGVVSGETWDLLLKKTNNEETTDEGIMPLEVGVSIEDVQKMLEGTLYYDGDITGVEDEETVNAIKMFQLNNDILADGNINERTIDTLEEAYSSLTDCTLVDEEEEGFESYTIKRGDTLYSIAKEFDTTVDYLKQINNLTTNTLIVGAKILVPKKGNSTNTTVYYTVKRGNTIFMENNEYMKK